MAEAVEHLFCKHEALSSNPITPKKIKKPQYCLGTEGAKDGHKTLHMLGKCSAKSSSATIFWAIHDKPFQLRWFKVIILLLKHRMVINILLNLFLKFLKIARGNN
jgi:hypothetical protein